MNELERKVAALEARQRRSNLGWLAVCVGLLASSQVGEQPAEERARRLEIVNTRGQTVLVIGSDERGNGMLRITNNKAKLVHELGVDGGAALQTLANARGSAVVQIGSDKAGGGAIETFNANADRTCFVGSNTKGDGGVRVSDRFDKRHFYIGDDVRGNGRVDLKDLPGRRLFN